ncbi:MAG: PHP domain-containing protein [Deltaproteobacteria bacterium]|nr:PHP domain-containing protein [Deltaproteobacteria bacterium]
MSTVDLHIHSAFSSDGEFAPAELVKLATQRGLSMISITDHNSVGGVKEVVASANIADVKMLAGIEIDCGFDELNLHVLGYGINIEDPAFAEIERNAKAEEKNSFMGAIRKLQSLGFEVTEAAVLHQSMNPIPVAEDIAEVLLQSPVHLDDARLAPYRPGASKSDMPNVHFYYDFCTRGKPAYVEKHWPDLRDVVRIIKDTGGIPVLAHPGASLRVPSAQMRQTLLAILETGIEGIEVFSSYHSREETDLFLEIAQNCGQRITCGSDFHGKHKPQILPGAIDCRNMDMAILQSFRDLALEL